MRAASRYGCGDGKRSYRHALAYQARQYAQALMAENADIYEPVRLPAHLPPREPHLRPFVGCRRSSRRGCYHFLASKGVEGLQKEGQCAILKSEIRAAHRAATLAKDFRTQCRMKKEGKHIRAAKCHFEAGTARLSAARILKPHPRKGTEHESVPIKKQGSSTKMLFRAAPLFSCSLGR